MSAQTFAFSIGAPFGIAWILLCLTASLIYRRTRGKPIFRPSTANPAFLETWRSGYSLNNLLTRLGSARNCLCVTIDQGSLHVAPHFPFNLLFLPEIFDLEFSAAGSAIRSAELLSGVFFFSGSRVRLTIEKASGGQKCFDLFLKNPKAFLDALAAIRQVT